MNEINQSNNKPHKMGKYILRLDRICVAAGIVSKGTVTPEHCQC